MGRATLLIAIVAVALGGAWWLSREASPAALGTNRRDVAAEPAARAGSYGPDVPPDPVAAAEDAVRGLPARAALGEGRRDASGTPEGAAVLGTVVAPSGAPIDGATVLLFEGPVDREPAYRRTPCARTRTGPDGRYVFPVSGWSSGSVVAFAPDHAPRWRNQRTGIDMSLTLEPTTRLSGRILGGPAADVRVLHGAWRFDGEMWAYAEHELQDGAGEYAVDDLQMGTTAKLVVIVGDESPFYERVRLDAPRVVHDIDVVDAVWIEGTVVDSITNEGVTGATIRWSTGEELATSAAGGAFRLLARGDLARAARAARTRDAPELDPARVERSLTVHAPGTLSTRLPGDALAVEEHPRLFLVPGGRVEGLVLRHDGVPAAGAWINWLDGTPLRVDPTGLMAWHGPGSGAVECDEQGRFTMDAVAWGRPHAALRVGYLETVRIVRGAAPDGPGETVRLTIRLPERPGLEGVVRWKGAVPATTTWFDLFEEADAELAADLGARVVLHGPIPTATAPNVAPATVPEPREVLTGRHGGFVFDGLAQGHYRLQAFGAHDDRARSQPQPIYYDGGVLPPQLVTIEPRAIEVRGRILDDGAPPQGQTLVELAPRSGGGTLFSFRRAWTDDRGEFTLSAVDFPGLCQQLSTRRGSAQLVLDVVRPGEEPILWELPARRAVRIRVPWPQVELAWTGPGPQDSGRVLGRIDVDAEGHATVELPRGSLELRARERAETRRPREVTRGVRIGADTEEIDLR